MDGIGRLRGLVIGPGDAKDKQAGEFCYLGYKSIQPTSPVRPNTCSWPRSIPHQAVFESRKNFLTDYPGCRGAFCGDNDN
jgi:hypothetical protein